MKQLMTTLLLLVILAAACSNPRTATNLTEAQVIDLVHKGTAEGKNYVIEKKDNGLFDVREQ